MPRQARKISETDYYHVIMRGNNKDHIFRTNAQKESFRDMIVQQEQEGTIEVIAWCIMDNHVHLVIKAKLEDMSLAFKKINIKYAMRYHKHNETVGHVFQDRYRSQPIESDEYLMLVVRYVHMNPVKAKMVRLPSDYKWSSYNDYLDKSIVNRSNCMQFFLSNFNMNVKKYEDFHRQVDDREYLEIKEDQEKMRMERAQNLIKVYCKKYDLDQAKEIYNNNEIFNEFINSLKTNSHLSLRQICKLIDIPYSSVQSRLSKGS